MNDILDPKQNILIMGDFNLHIGREDDPDTFKFKEMFHALGMRQSVDFLPIGHGVHWT